MKANLHTCLIAGLMLLLSACNKPEDEAPSQAFLKKLEVSGMYFARGAVEMPDGSTIVGSVGFENASIPSEYGILPSLLTKLDARGRQEWQIELPLMIHELWECHLLSNGNILALGFEDQPFPERVGTAVISPAGEVLHSLLIPNQTIAGFSNTSRASLSAMELSNGEIALAMPSAVQANSLTRLRLVRLSHELEIIDSRVYQPGNPLPSTMGMVFPHLREDTQGNLLIFMSVIGPRNQPTTHFAATIKLNAPDYIPEYIQYFLPGEGDAMHSSMALSSAGEAVWASSGIEGGGPANIFNQRHQELFRLGREFTVWKTNGNDDDTQTAVYGGFPKFGFIQTVAPCSDGGYILAGTCNINEDQNIPSAFRIMLVKLNASLGLEWLRMPNTDTPSFGAQAVEIQGGFLVTASNAPDEGVIVPYVFKTDFQGVIR